MVMQWSQSLWEREVAQFGPLEVGLSMDLKIQFFKLMLATISTLTILNPLSPFRVTYFFDYYWTKSSLIKNLTISKQILYTNF